MNDNLKLWDLVERTDPAHTKPITGKSYKGNSPKPHWIIKRATETFGPCGIGWGFTIEERVEKGALLADGHFDRLHVAKVKVWYFWEGKRGEVEHIGGTPFSGKRSDGRPYSDEDAPKKSVTDALIKALSMIGFAGDIFLGRYDDSKYVKETNEDFREAERDTSPSATEILTLADKSLMLAAEKGPAALKEAWIKLSPATRELFGEAGACPKRFKDVAAKHNQSEAA